MKFLLITMTPLFYNNSATMRTCGYISGLRNKSNTIDVISPSYDMTDLGYDKTNEDFVKEHVHKYYTFDRGSIYSAMGEKKSTNAYPVRKWLKNILRKVYSFIQIYDSQKIIAKRVAALDIDLNTYDKIISVSDPKSSHLIVIELAKKSSVDIQKKWIQCWGDPWYFDITGPSGKGKKALIKREEYKLLSKALTVVYTSPFTLEAQMRLFPMFASKMKCVTQSCKKYKDDIDSNEIKYEVGYFGTYNSHVRNILPLYECCNENCIKSCIVGDGDIDIKSTSWCDIKGKMSSGDAEKEEMTCDILVCICNLHGTQIPGKIYYCAGYNKNIIIVVDGEYAEELAEYFSTFSRFIICKNTKEDINRAIGEAKKKKYLPGKILDERFNSTYFAKVICNEE